MKRKNIITSLIVGVTFVLAGVGIFTALRLYQLRGEAVAPNAPQSKLFAWDCSTYTFSVEQAGDVFIQNASDRTEPAQKVDVLIDNAKVATFDVPGFGPRSPKTKLGHVDVPLSGKLSWKVVGSLDCQNSGSFGNSACAPNVDIMLVVDRSSTMNGTETDGRTKLAWAKEAATQFVDKVMSFPNNSVKIGVSSFGAQGNDGTGQLSSTNNSTLHTALSSNITTVKQAVSSIAYKQSGTCIECGLRIANTEIASSLKKKIVVLLSDGMANHVWNGTTSNAKQKAIDVANAGRSNGVTYYVLGYGKSGAIDEGTLKSIAGTTANYQYKPNGSDWASGFLNIVDQICLATPTPTPTATPTASPTASPTSSPTPTATATTTPTTSPTSSPTSTPATNACSLNFSLTSSTSSPTPTATATATPTTSPTSSPTSTPQVACNKACSTDATCKAIDSSYTCYPPTSTCRLSAFPDRQECNIPATTSPTPHNAFECNSVCSTNSECLTIGANYTCFSTGADKRCRLTTNTGSLTCKTGGTGTPTTTTTGNVGGANTNTSPTPVTLPSAGIGLPTLTLIFGGAILTILAIIVAL